MLESSAWLGREPVAVLNPEGRGPWVLVCDHASNWVPPALQGLGLPPKELERHIAWDPGALELARQVSTRLDAPLVHTTVSRLVLDVNRDPSHVGSMVTVSEETEIPGNRALSAAERSRRVRAIYEPYHSALGRLVASRSQPPHLISIHSFTPVFRGASRPWHIGVLSAADRRIADPLLEWLRAGGDLNVGDNQPYAPADGVYHTLETHCAARSLHSVLLELRADLIDDDLSRSRWATILCRALQAIH